jgi:hypothetical protein
VVGEAGPGAGRPAATRVWRRIPPWHFPKKQGQERPDSAAFDDGPEGPMSVVIAREGRDPHEVLVGHDGFGLVELAVDDLRTFGLRLEPDPDPSEPDHAAVVGQKTKIVRRQLAKAARWVVPPP